MTEPLGKHTDRPRFKRPTSREKWSMVYLGFFAIIPVVFMLLGAPWALALFFAVMIWPSLFYIGWLAWQKKQWPVLIGGPSIGWYGRRR